MLKIPPGTDVDTIERIVREEYQGSAHVFPKITKDNNRVHVSLLSQQAGNCTAIVFRIEDGVVVDRMFSAD
jgi:hypothetical protein